MFFIVFSSYTTKFVKILDPYDFKPKRVYNEKHLRIILNPIQYQITQQYTNLNSKNPDDLDRFYGEGKYNCFICNQVLFDSYDKIGAEHFLIWPTFSKPTGDVTEIKYNPAWSEESGIKWKKGQNPIRCDNCGSHVGTVQVLDYKKAYSLNPAAILVQLELETEKSNLTKENPDFAGFLEQVIPI